MFASRVGFYRQPAAAVTKTYVAVGWTAFPSAGVILRSTNATSWSTASTAYQLYAVCYGNNQFVAVGRTGTIVTSPNGSSWTAQTSGTTRDLFGVAYSPTLGLYVAAGGTGYNAGGSSDQGTILTSTNGITWTTISTTLPWGIQNVIWGGTLSTPQFILAGGAANTPGSGGTWYSSTDGINFTLNTSGSSWASYFGAVANGTNLGIVGEYYVGGWSAAAVNLNSSINTIESVSGTVISGRSIAYGSSKYCAVGNKGTTGNAWYSTTGAAGTWTSVSQAGNNYVIWDGLQFISVGNSGAILTSSDANTWTSQTSGTTTDLRGIAST